MVNLGFPMETTSLRGLAIDFWAPRKGVDRTRMVWEVADAAAMDGDDVCGSRVAARSCTLVAASSGKRASGDLILKWEARDEEICPPLLPANHRSGKDFPESLLSHHVISLSLSPHTWITAPTLFPLLFVYFPLFFILLNKRPHTNTSAVIVAKNW